MSDVLRLGVEFEVEPDSELRGRGFKTLYRDTVWLTEQEYGGPFTAAVLNRIKAGTDAKVNALKLERHANWKQNVLNPPPPEPAPEDTDPNVAAREAVLRAQEALGAANAALLATVELAEEVTPEG